MTETQKEVATEVIPCIMEICEEMDQSVFIDKAQSEEQTVLEEPVTDEIENFPNYVDGYEVHGIPVDYLATETSTIEPVHEYLSTTSENDNKYLSIAVVGENNEEQQYLIIQENDNLQTEDDGVETCIANDVTVKTENTQDNDETSSQLLNQYGSSNNLFFIRKDKLNNENSSLVNNSTDEVVEMNAEVGHMLEVSYEEPVEPETLTFPDGLQPLLIPADSCLVPCEDSHPMSLLIDGKQYNIFLTDPVICDNIFGNNEMTLQIACNSGKESLTNTSSVNSRTTSRKSYVMQNRIQHKCKEEGCNKSYNSHHHLQVHMRNHLGIRPYECPAEGCGKAFSTAYSLIVHVRIHTGEKPYECVEANCKKAFKTSGDLQRHMRIHTGDRPFKCTVEGCDKAFNTNNILKIHARTHTGEKPFTCDLCKKKFPSSTNYRNHMRTHSGERPYACTVPGCTSKFAEYSSLYKHGKVHIQRDSAESNAMNQDGGKIVPVKANILQRKKSLSGMPTIRASRAKLKKPGKLNKSAIRLSTSLQLDEIDHQDNLIPLGGDDFEVYQLILDDDFTSCV